MQEILTYSISSIILSGGFYALFRAFLQGERAFALNRWILLGLVALSLALPALSFTDIFRVNETSLPAPRESVTKIVGRGLENSIFIGRPLEIKFTEPGSESNTPVVPDKSLETPKKSAAARKAEGSFPYALIVAAIYLIGLLGLLTRFLYGVFKVSRLYKRGRIIRFNNFKICEVGEEIAPFSFWNTIYLPAGAYSEEEKRQIILHERAHVSQKHSLDLILLEIACSLGWFNPFLRLFKKSAIELHEYLADSATLSAGVSKIDYSSTLYKNLTGEKLFASSHYLNKDQIKRRLKMMSKAANSKFSALKYALVIPAVAIIGLVFSCSQEAPSHATNAKGMQVELYTLVKSSGAEKEVKLNYPGGEKALAQLILSEPGFQQLAKRNDNSLELTAKFKVAADGKAQHPNYTEVSEYNDNNSMEKYKLNEKLYSVVDKFPKLEVGKSDLSKGEIEAYLKITFGTIKRNAYETSMKQPRPDVFPTYPGTYNDMEKFIASRVKMPKEAAENKVNAKVHVYFFVEPDGSITEPMVKSYKINDMPWEKGELYGCDQEAIRVVKAMPKWKAAMKNGKPIRYAVSVPIMFGDLEIWNAKNQSYIQFEPIAGTKLANAPKNAYPGRPEFEYNKITSFINENVKYPKSQIAGNISGVVLVSFELTNKGEFANPKIERGINSAFDEEALRVVRMLKPVKPMTDNDGKPMGYKIITTVPFKL